MTAVFIGDIQGCDISLRALLKRCEEKWGSCDFTMLGDLVNRGPGSLAVVRLMMERGYMSVLGNHELYLLAAHVGIMKRKVDTLDEIWFAKDRQAMIDWIRHLPILISHDAGILVHAGILPAWRAEQMFEYAQAIEAGLRGPQWHAFLSRHLGPSAIDSELTTALQCFTRMRFLTSSGALDHTFKGPPESAPEHLRPWFEDYNGELGTVFFGHWAALGARRLTGAVSLDSGCVWGRELTAFSPVCGSFIHQSALE